MAIHLDILAELDQRAAEEQVRSLVEIFGRGGEKAAEAFGTGLGKLGSTSQTATAGLRSLNDAQSALALTSERVALAQLKYHDAVSKTEPSIVAVTSAHNNLLSALRTQESQTQRVAEAQEKLNGSHQSAIGYLASHSASLGEWVGVATAAAGAAVGLVAALAKVGDVFEDMNRQIVLTTGASGQALEDLNSRAQAIAATIDTTTKSVGDDLGTVTTRLGLTGDAAQQVVTHISELRDRFGALDTRQLAAGLTLMGVAAGDVDKTLASLTQTAAQTATPIQELNSLISANAATLHEAGLTYEQSAHLLGEAGAALGPGAAAKAVAGIEYAGKVFADPNKGLAKPGEDFAHFMDRAAQSVEKLAQTDPAGAQKLSELLFGPRRWAESLQLIQQFEQTVHSLPGAFAAPAKSIDELAEKTRTLPNLFTELRNHINEALRPQAGTVVDVVGDKIKELTEWVDAHRDDLRRMFDTALEVIGDVAKGLTEVIGFLSRFPGLIEAVVVGFAAWKTIEGVAALITALTTIATSLETKIPAAAAVAGNAISAAMLGATAGILAVQQLLDKMDRDAEARANRRPDTAPPGGGPSLTTPAYVPGLPGIGAPQGGWGPAPSGIPGVPYVPGLTPEPSLPGGPLPPGVAPVLPGAGGPAATPGGDIPDSDLLTPEDFASKGKGKKGPKGPRLPVAPEIPYGAGYGEPPAPGESIKQWEQQQSILEKQHDVAEKQARLNQLEQDNNATQEDIQKAKNALLRAQMEEQKSELTTTTKHTDDMTQLGAKIDEGFGLSKGLPGLADNLVKFLANLAFAPVLGALGGVEAAGGGVKGKGSGLVGLAAQAAGFGGSEESGASVPSFEYPGNPKTIGEFGAAGNRVGALYAFANSMVGTPYSTALRNDCSGMVSRLANVALGLPPQVDFDTTGEGAWLQQHGFQSGVGPPGSFQVGWNPAPGMSGHTAATLPGGVNAEQGGSNSAFTLGPRAAGGASSQFPQHAYLPMSYDQGGAVPIMAHEGEHVLTAQDVNAMGGQQGVYNFRAGLQNGGQSGTDNNRAYPTGPGRTTDLPGLKWINGQPSIPAGLQHFDIGGGIGPIAPIDNPGGATGPGAPLPPGVTRQPQIGPFPVPQGITPPPTPGGGPPAAAPGQQGPTRVGGAEPPKEPGGGNAGGSGGAIGGAPLAALQGAASGLNALAPGAGIAAQIGIQEINRGIQYAGQVAGIGVQALGETFKPTGESQLAASGWFSRIAGGIASTKPALPNMAGQSQNMSAAGKAGAGGPTPEGVTSGTSPFGALSAGPAAQIGPAVHIENYQVSSTEDKAGADLARHQISAGLAAGSAVTGTR